MARRTKHEMEQMKDDCRYYLLNNSNDAHKAHEAMIKEYLPSTQPIPYYIQGVKDFIKVSQELAFELNRKDQMKKADKARFETKETLINYIIDMSKEEVKAIYKAYKDTLSKSNKLCIHDILFLKLSNETITKKDIDQETLNVFSQIYNEQMQPA